MSTSRYVLHPAPPVRAFFFAAIGFLVSAVLIVLAVSNGWSVIVLILAAILGIAAVALAVAGFVSMASMAVTVTMTDEGYRIVGAGQERHGRWAEVTRVTETTDGRHITIYHGDITRTHLLCPSGTQTVQFQAVLADMAKRLDAAYGYGGPSISSTSSV